MRVRRVILAVNNHIHYLNFWPIVAHAWKRGGYIPTLFFMGSKTEFPFAPIPGTVVYYVPPISEVSTVSQSRLIRLFVPTLFPDDICMTADIDLVPIELEFFERTLACYSDDKFVTMMSCIYPKQPWRYALSYYVAKGSTFAEIVGIDMKKKRSYRELMSVFSKKIQFLDQIGWFKKTDEYFFCVMLHIWKQQGKRLVKLRRSVPGTEEMPVEYRLPSRFQAGMWKFDKNKLNNGQYIDMICKNPIQLHFKHMQPLLSYIKYDYNNHPITSYGQRIIPPKGSPPKYEKVTPEMIKTVLEALKKK